MLSFQPITSHTRVSRNLLPKPLRRMTTYEVRERKLVYHYYRVEANSKKEAKLKAQDPANLPEKVNTIVMMPEIDYAVQVSPEGELIQ